jgi:DNA replication initiation complex subunit (GINS family)
MLENDNRTPTEKKLQESLVQAVTLFRANVLNTLQEIKE